VGPGASSRISLNGGRYAIKQVLRPKEWMRSVAEGSHDVLENHKLTRKQHIQEVLLCGLRRVRGVSQAEIAYHTMGKTLDQLFGDHLSPLAREGLLVVNEDRVRCTPRGLLLLDSILVRVFDDMNFD